LFADKKRREREKERERDSEKKTERWQWSDHLDVSVRKIKEFYLFFFLLSFSISLSLSFSLSLSLSGKGERGEGLQMRLDGKTDQDRQRKRGLVGLGNWLDWTNMHRHNTVKIGHIYVRVCVFCMCAYYDMSPCWMACCARGWWMKITNTGAVERDRGAGHITVRMDVGKHHCDPSISGMEDKRLAIAL